MILHARVMNQNRDRTGCISLRYHIDEAEPRRWVAHERRGWEYKLRHHARPITLRASGEIHVPNPNRVEY